MHVCHLSDGSFGGDYFRNIAEGLEREGIDLSLVEIGPGSAPTWMAGVKRVRYHSLGAASKVAYPRAVWRLSRYLKANRVELLHTHLFYGGLIGALARLLSRRTVFAMMRHHTSVVRLLGSRWHVAMDRWMAEKADHVITVSEAAKRYMTDVDGIRRDDIEVVYLGFDFRLFRSDAELRKKARLSFGFRDDDFVVGYVGNIVPGKGHLELVGAFADVIDHAPNAKLLLLGRGEIPELNAAIERLPPGTVVNAGWRDDAVPCYNAMDLFVQPSLSEAFSQVIIEAMGVRLPVIATDVGGAREVIESEVNGVIVPPGDVDELAKSIIRILSDALARDRLAERGQKSVHERFTASQMVERHVGLYSQWLKRREN